MGPPMPGRWDDWESMRAPESYGLLPYPTERPSEFVHLSEETVQYIVVAPVVVPLKR